MDLRRHAAALAGCRITAPWRRADAETSRRRRALEPGHQRQLVVGRRKRCRQAFEARCRDAVDLAEAEQRERHHADPAGEQQHRQQVCENAGRRLAGEAQVRPHRHGRGDECTRGVAGNQQRAHVARDEHGAEQHRDDKQQRPGITKERSAQRPGPRQALGQRPAAQEKEPGRAADQPDAAELRGELAQVGQQQPERRNAGQRDDNQQRNHRPAAQTARDAAAGLARNDQAPGQAVRQRPAQEQQDREHQHCEPQMPLVVERQVAVGRVAVGRQVEQQQPAQAGCQDQAGIADTRTRRRSECRGCRGCMEAPAADRHQQHDGGAAEQPKDKARRSAVERRVERRVEPSRLELAMGCQRPRHAGQPGGARPQCQRGRDAQRRRTRTPAPQQESETDTHRPRPLPAGALHQVTHRLVLAFVGGRLVRVAHQGRAGRQRLARVDRTGCD